MAIESWKILSRKLRDNSPRRTMEDVVFELPNGRVESFPLFHHVRKCVVVVAITSDQKIILARQYRPGPGRVLDELPGGCVEDNEDFEVAIRRELLEETGFACQNLEYLGCPFESPYSTVERHAFLATGCFEQAKQSLDEDEFIEVVLKSVPDFIQQVAAGQSTDLEIAWMGLFRAGILGTKA